MQRMRQNTMLAAVVLMSVAVAFAGCGGGSQAPPTTPVTQNASVTGQYNLVLTSTNGKGTTNIYTDFTQSGTTFTGAASTLVCPSNDLSQCKGDDAPVISIAPSGTVSGANVTMMISFRDYSGTFNSTSNPLPITPTILITLAQDASFNLTGKATIMNSPCISSLTLSGQAIGDAFSLTDAASKALIIALPTGNSFTFSYNFQPTAANCAGDFGRGVVMTNQFPWDY